MSRTASVISLALLLLVGEYSLALAQEVEGKTAQELKKVDPVPPATGKSLPEQAGTQEPSTKATGATPSSGVFVNGVLTVPGAAPDGETAPSKYSARNAEIDKLPIAAFKLRHLSDAQKAEIHRQLHGARGGLALSPAYAMVGATIPSEIALRDLKPVDADLSAKFPELRGAFYISEGPNLLLVGTNNVVIGVLSEP